MARGGAGVRAALGFEHFAYLFEREAGRSKIADQQQLSEFAHGKQAMSPVGSLDRLQQAFFLVKAHGSQRVLR